MSYATPESATAMPWIGNRLTIGHVYLVLAIAAATGAALWRRLPPHDLWWHMSMGRTIAETGVVPTADRWTFTQFGAPFYDQPWAAQVGMYRVFQLGGLELLATVNALLVGLSVAFLLRALVRVTGHRRLTAVPFLAVAMPLAVASYMMRPQTLGVVLFTVMLGVLLRHRAGHWPRAVLFVLPLLTVVWANSHGSVILAPVLVGIFLVGNRLDARAVRSARDHPRSSSSLALPAVLCVLATLVNPVGFRLWEFTLLFPRHDTVRLLATEWAPTWPTDFDGIVFWVVLSYVGGLLIWSRRMPTRTDLLLLGVFAAFALSARRNTVWFGLVAAVVITLHFAAVEREAPEERVQVGMNRLIAATALLAIVALLPWWRSPAASGHTPLLGTDTPVAAAEYLSDLGDKPRRLFTDIGYASYVTWTSAGTIPVFMDGRLELYPQEQALDYAAASAGRNSVRLLDSYSVDAVLASRATQAGLIDALVESGNWTTLYEDPLAVYLVPTSDA